MPRVSIPLTLLAVFLTSLWFYARLRSFPLIGEDGASNYVSLLEAVRAPHPFSLLVGFKLFEGLGQPNLFYSVLADPFNWLMYLPLSPDNAFRIAWSLRATVCWLMSYLFFTRLAVSRSIAVTAALLNVILCFPLGIGGGVPSWAGIHHMTQLVFLPALLWLYLGTARPHTRPLARLALVPGVLVFLLSYPLNSLMGLLVVAAFALCHFLTSSPANRRSAFYAFATLLAIALVILFVPYYGLYRTWTALTRNAARVVFANELHSLLLATYTPPAFWRYVPIEVRIIILLACGVLLRIGAVEAPLRAVLLTLILLVVTTQTATLLFSVGVARTVFLRLPAPSRLELYLTPFYAVLAALSLHSLPSLLRPTRAHLAAWLIRFSLVLSAIWILIEPRAAVYGLALPSLFAAIPSAISRTGITRRLLSKARHTFPFFGMLLPHAVVLALLASAFTLWIRRPDEAYHPFGGDILCKRRRHLWCADKSGPSMNAATNPITSFLASRLTMDDIFRGRADTLLNHDPTDPPDESTTRTDMIRDRTRHYHLGKNGLLLSSLPFQGIPVASSYEQTTDYLYYLLWTRYINRATGLRPTVNFTALYRVSPAALALVGVRFLIVSPIPLRHDPTLPLAFTWSQYRIYDIPHPNISGFSPTHIRHAGSLAGELSLMYEESFEPSNSLILSSAALASLPSDISLSPHTHGTIRLSDNLVSFTTASAGRHSLVILPFRFSHCWTPKWRGLAGRLLRVDLALLGIFFERQVDVTLTWKASYLNHDCLLRDSELIPQARLAASRFSY